MTYTLIYPLIAMFLLTFAVMIYMAAGRFSAIKSGAVDPRYFKTYAGTVPENLLLASRHFTNLFEVPVLFYVGIILAIIINIQGSWIHIWAWLFVAARVAHALIHLGGNKVRARLFAYAIGWFAVTAVWVVVAYETMSRA
jgi:hypothetical protein